MPAKQFDRGAGRREVTPPKVAPQCHRRHAEPLRRLGKTYRTELADQGGQVIEPNLTPSRADAVCQPAAPRLPLLLFYHM